MSVSFAVTNFAPHLTEAIAAAPQPLPTSNTFKLAMTLGLSRINL